MVSHSPNPECYICLYTIIIYNICVGLVLSIGVILFSFLLTLVFDVIAGLPPRNWWADIRSKLSQLEVEKARLKSRGGGGI